MQRLNWLIKNLRSINQRSIEERIVLSLCSLGLLALAPFAFVRILRGDYLIAAVDLAGMISSLLLTAYVLQTGRIKGPGIILAFVSLIGIVTIVWVQDSGDVHFIYPVILWSFFLVRPNLALIASLVANLLIVPIILNHHEPLISSQIAMSILGCIFFAYAFSTLRNRQRDELMGLSRKDGLTGAGNRRALDEKIKQSILAFDRNEANLSLLLLDLDNFKIINDQLGHGMGDQILVSITQIIESRIRATDSLYRYGGDEFVVLANGADLETALGLAEDIRARVETNEIIHEAKVSLSLGVSQYKKGQSPEEWLGKADSALLKAKREGRNMVLAALA